MRPEGAESELEKGTNFPWKLVPSDLSHALSYIEGRNDKVVRKESADRFSAALHMPDINDAAERSDELFRELGEVGVAVAPMERFIEKVAGKEAVIYTVSKKLGGEALSKISLEKQEEIGSAVSKIDSGLASLVRYLSRKYAEKGEYLSDIYSGDQYVYDKNDAESPGIYLVALDTKVATFKPDEPNTDLSRCMEGIFLMIRSAEEKLGWKPLVNARTEFINFLNALPPTDANKDKLLPLLSWFSD